MVYLNPFPELNLRSVDRGRLDQYLIDRRMILWDMHGWRVPVPPEMIENALRDIDNWDALAKERTGIKAPPSIGRLRWGLVYEAHAAQLQQVWYWDSVPPTVPQTPGSPPASTP